VGMVYANKERTVAFVQMTVHPIWVPMLRQKIRFVAREVRSKWFTLIECFLVVTIISVMKIHIVMHFQLLYRPRSVVEMEIVKQEKV